MGALVFILCLFVLAIVAPWIFPNKMVSKHPKDSAEE